MLLRLEKKLNESNNSYIVTSTEKCLLGIVLFLAQDSYNLILKLFCVDEEYIGSIFYFSYDIFYNIPNYQSDGCSNKTFKPI